VSNSKKGLGPAGLSHSGWISFFDQIAQSNIDFYRAKPATQELVNSAHIA
jgi:hypothetical protein